MGFKLTDPKRAIAKYQTQSTRRLSKDCTLAHLIENPTAFQFKRDGNFKIFAVIFLKLDGGEALPLNKAVNTGDTAS